jgi:hypothetical protein
MRVLLRAYGWEAAAEVGEPSADGTVLARIAGSGTFMPFRDTGERTADGLPVFEYAM